MTLGVLLRFNSIRTHKNITMNPKPPVQNKIIKGGLIQLGLIFLSFLPLASMNYFSDTSEAQEVISVELSEEFADVPYIARP